MELSPRLHEHIADLKRELFLRRIAEEAQGDPARAVPVGLLGEQMGLPYEQALAIADRLGAAGWIERPADLRLEPPHGPRVHILPEGIAHVREQMGVARA
jgi:hypothetical protein